MITPKDCPVLAAQQHIQHLSHDMALALKKLRSDLMYCDTCSLAPEECPLRQELSSAVHTAIQEITEEWNLVQIFQRDDPC